ncbi:MAG TPA: pilus assembly protein TadG-related protein [Actinomycetota bacterium]
MLRGRTETGSIAPLLAAAISGLVIVSLFGANAASLYAVRREARKAADLAALAGVAAIPLTGVLASGEPHATACAQAARTLTTAAAPFSTSLSTSGVAPSCDAGVTVEPIADWTMATDAQAAIEDLIALLGLSRPDLCHPLVAPLVDPLLGALTETDCARVQQAIDGMPENLSPATVTPRLRVTVAGDAEAPVPLPAFAGARSIDATATARRRFKNLIVLPAVRTDALTGLPQPAGDLYSGAPMSLDAIEPNPVAADARDRLMPVLWDAHARMRDAITPHMPPGTSFDLTQLLLDAADLFDPPRGDAPVSVLDVAAEAARTGDPVVVLRLLRMPVLGIPAFDFTVAYLSPLADGTFEATPIPAEQLTTARGLFTATVVK